jgi:hypothetical protein
MSENAPLIELSKVPDRRERGREARVYAVLS